MVVSKCAVFHLLLLLIQPWAPPNWLPCFHTPKTTNPHLHLTYNPATKPPKEKQHKWMVYCASKIPDIPPPKKRGLWSLINARPIPPSPPSKATQKQLWSTRLEKATLSTPRLRYPSVPMTHTHPNPHRAPNSELVWPLRIPPAGPWLAPLAETMATSWE